MARRTKRQWHAQNDSPDLSRFGLGCGSVFAVSVGVGLLTAIFGSWVEWLAAPLAVLLAATYVLFPAIVRGSLRAGIQTDDEGLTERYPLFFRRRVRWADITAAQVTDFHARLHHPRAVVVLAPPLADWAQIAGRAQRHLGETPTVEAHEDDVLCLPPEEVAAWLGIARDGQLVCSSRFHRRWLWWVMVPLMAVGLFRAPPLFMLVWLAFFASGLGAVTGRRRDRRVREVRATATSLEVRSDAGWRTLAWGGIKDLRRTGLFWVVQTVEGDIWLPPRLTGAEPLLHAVRRAIEARRSGWALPRMVGDVPESALSPAQFSVDVDRGLSRLEANADSTPDTGC